VTWHRRRAARPVVGKGGPVMGAAGNGGPAVAGAGGGQVGAGQGASVHGRDGRPAPATGCGPPPCSNPPSSGDMQHLPLSGIFLRAVAVGTFL
jgi:hypothetical protein